MLNFLIRRLVQAADLTPAGIARRLLAEQQRGAPVSEVAAQIAAVPGVDDFLEGNTGADYWNRLMADPGASAAIHPMNRAALRAYVCQVVDEVRRLRRFASQG